MPAIDARNPVDVYVNSIRSVLFVDDQFPTFSDHETTLYDEVDRARSLWRGCTERGWLCDVENRVRSNGGEDEGRLDRIVKRISNSDLLVLDYHLDGQDPKDALKIVARLARDPSPNLVVVYTAETNLRDVLLSMAIAARGRTELPTDAPESRADVDIDFDVPWRTEDVAGYLTGSDSWHATWSQAWADHREEFGLPEEVPLSRGALKLDEYLSTIASIDASNLGKIDRIAATNDERWFQCGNLFLVVVRKFVNAGTIGTEDAGQFDEHTALIGQLEAAIRSWNPPWLGCAIAVSRRTISDGAFRDDVVLPSDALQQALLHYINRATDDETKQTRSIEVAEHLLERRFARGAAELASALTTPVAVPDGDEEPKLVELNAFLASTTSLPRHITLGTILRMGQEYWVCASPACDMVPRTPTPPLTTWASQVDPFKPFQAVRLDVLSDPTRVKKAAREAEAGRNIFFHEMIPNGVHPSGRVGKCFEDHGDPRPKLELMFATDQGALRDRKVKCLRCIQHAADATDGGGNIAKPRLAFQESECEVVGQLRAPYAARFLQYVGAHLGRIGVDYVGKARNG